jgi:hypothetical protein|tara:strand:- start:9037 stop:9267 length:231 start_codon:yes stop_codon:yes gene_type:complete
MAKLKHFINTRQLLVEELSDKSGYKIYTSDAALVWFLLMVPFIGSIIAFVGWIFSITRNREVPDKKRSKIIFSSIK